MSIFRYFAEKHTFAILITIMVLLYGGKRLYETNKDMFPDADFGQMVISTIYPGASPVDVEQNVTNKIEKAIDGIVGIKEYESTSVEGQSSVEIKLEADLDDQDKVKNEITEAVNRISDFPENLVNKPSVISVDSGVFPLLEVGFSSDKLSYTQLRKQAKLFEKRLLRLKGIARVSKSGFEDREYRIQLNPDKLSDYQIPITSVISSLKTNNSRSSLGTLKTTNKERTIVMLSELKTVKAVEEIILLSTFSGGNVVRLKDVATVKDTFSEPVILARMNGIPAINFMVYKSKNADIVKTSDRVKALINDSNDIFTDIKIQYAGDFSRYVSNRFSVVKSNGSIGFICLLLVLVIFLHHRVAFWVALGIPVTILGVFSLLPFFVSRIDIISLAAMIIVMGVVVDDAIIISENILRRREKGDSPIDAAVNGISEVFSPVLTTILTTFIAFAPMFFMPGIVGKFIFVIPLVISLALFVSLIEVTIGLPAHMAPGLAKIPPLSEKNGKRWFQQFKAFFNEKIKVLLRFRYLMLPLYGILFGGTLYYAFTQMDFSLFPPDSAENVRIHLELEKGSSLEQTASKTAEVEAVLATIPSEEVMAFSTRIGMASSDGFEVETSVNSSFISLYLTSFSKRTRTAYTIVDELREQTDKIKGIKSLEYNVDSGGPPVGRAIEIRVSSEEDHLRTQAVNKITAVLQGIKGTKDIVRNDEPGRKRIKLHVDKVKAARLGLSVTDITTTVSTAFRGIDVASVQVGTEDIDLRVIYPKSARGNFNRLKTLKVPNRQGRLIRLDEVVSFKEIVGEPNLYHYQGERAITILGNVAKDKVTIAEVYKQLEEGLGNEPFKDVTVTYGGESQETNESFQSLFRTFIIALLGIYFLLVLLFNNMFQPFMVLAAIPFGLMGVIAAFALHNEPLGFMAMLGTIGLVGVLVNDALVLVYHINHLRHERPEEPLLELVAEGAANRLRPIMLTSLTTIAGVLPLAYGIGGSDPFIAPMGLALGYGLIFSTPFILILVPAIYLVLGDMVTFRNRIFRKK